MKTNKENFQTLRSIR